MQKDWTFGAKHLSSENSDGCLWLSSLDSHWKPINWSHFNWQTSTRYVLRMSRYIIYVLITTARNQLFVRSGIYLYWLAVWFLDMLCVKWISWCFRTLRRNNPSIRHSLNGVPNHRKSFSNFIHFWSTVKNSSVLQINHLPWNTELFRFTFC